MTGLVDIDSNNLFLWLWTEKMWQGEPKICVSTKNLYDHKEKMEEINKILFISKPARIDSFP